MAWLKRASGTGVSGVPGAALDDPAFAKAFPALLEFVSLTAWEDGGPRKPGTVLLFAEEGRWKCCLLDKDAGTIAFLTAGTHAELLKTVEKQLEAGTVEWRKQKPWAGRKG